ncbi:MAG: hypothetical protein F7B19_01345, partial [Desulfurococcales archaeon]|nr:hypothetical protein [Desulfurococcales archaeon]
MGEFRTDSEEKDDHHHNNIIYNNLYNYIKDFYRLLLLLLILDRKSSGLWSRLAPFDIAREYVKNDPLLRNIVQIQGSLSLTSLSLEDILYCIGIPNDNFIKTIKFIVNEHSHKYGGFGLKVPDPRQGYRIDPNPRHTGLVLRILLLLGYPINHKDYCIHVEYLIKTQGDKGGWGVVPVQSEDPVTTSMIIEVLKESLVLCKQLDENIKKSLIKGITYLEDSFDNGWISDELFLDKIKTTSLVLTLFTDLRIYNYELYSKALNLIINFYNSNCRSEIRYPSHCFYVLNALAENSVVRADAIENFILKIIKNNLIDDLFTNKTTYPLDLIVYLR